MAEIKTEINVDADPEVCYNLAKDMEQFPTFMDNVKDVTVQESGEGWTITSWEATLQGRKVTWEERDEFDDESRLITFEQTEGDLSVFDGRWSFTRSSEGGCNIKLAVEATLGMPMLSAALDPIVKRLLRENCEQMLQGIKSEAEKEE